MKSSNCIALAAALMLSGGNCLRAQSSADVTIVYDVQAREFRCWYEGERREWPGMQKVQNVPKVALACPSDMHPFYQGIHFYAGQAIYLQYIGAHVGDLFAPASTSTELAEPAVPVFGAGSGLPAITKLFAPAVTTVKAPGTQAVQAVASPRSALSNLTGTLDRLSNADFKQYIQSALIDIVATEKASKALVFANSNALETLTRAIGPIPKHAQDILANVTALMGTAPPQLGWLQVRYCSPSNSALTAHDAAADFPVYNDRLLDLTQLMSQQAALVQEVIALEIKLKADDVVAQINAYQDPAVSGFSSPVAKTLDDFANKVRASGYLQAPSIIDNIAVVGGKYEPAPTGSLLDDVNKTGLPVNATTLGQLKDNLKTLVSKWSEIEDAIQRYKPIAAYADKLEAYKAQPDNVFNMQAGLNELSRLLIDAGAAANCIAQGMPLPEPFDRPSLGTWYTSQTIALEIKRGTRLPAYDLSGIETTTQTSVTRDTAAGKATTSAPQDASTSVAKTVFQIHNTYHFEFAAGFMRSWFHDVKYQVFQRTVTSGGSSTTENFFAQTESHDYRFLATADLIYYPFKREFFPWRARYPGERQPPRYKELGLLAGFSITDPTKDFFLGAAWVPRTGIGIQGGIHFGFVDGTPPVPLGQAITNGVTSVSQRLDHGGFIGLVMHMQVFKDVFGAIFK
jgi:hypothetical protein